MVNGDGQWKGGEDAAAVVVGVSENTAVFTSRAEGPIWSGNFHEQG